MQLHQLLKYSIDFIRSASAYVALFIGLIDALAISHGACIDEPACIFDRQTIAVNILQALCRNSNYSIISSAYGF